MRFAVGTVYTAYHPQSFLCKPEATTALQIEQSRDPLDVLTAGRVNSDGGLLDAAIAPAIREAIVAGLLPGGTRLSEAQVARRLRVSRTPVRRALNQLEHERLVVIVPHIGASVRALTPQEVEEIYEVRIALEVLAVRLLIERITAVGRAQLGEALRALRAAEHDADTYADALDALHLLVMRLSGNRTVVQIYESLVGPIRRARRMNLGRAERIRRSLRANQRIGRLILAADRTAAATMEEHLRRSMNDVIAILKQENTRPCRP